MANCGRRKSTSREGSKERTSKKSNEDKQARRKRTRRMKRSRKRGEDNVHLYAELHTKTFTIFSHVLMSYSEKKDENIGFLNYGQ